MSLLIPSMMTAPKMMIRLMAVLIHGGASRALSNGRVIMKLVLSVAENRPRITAVQAGLRPLLSENDSLS